MIRDYKPDAAPLWQRLDHDLGAIVDEFHRLHGLEALMALSWLAGVTHLDSELVIAPERYSSKRSAQTSQIQNTAALTEIAKLNRSTVNTVGRDLAGKRYIVLDTTHAVEGKILFCGKPVKGAEVGSVKRPLKAGDVIVSRLRPYLRQIALVDETLLERHEAEAICSTEFYILEPLEGGPRHRISCAVLAI